MVPPRKPNKRNFPATPSFLYNRPAYAFVVTGELQPFGNSILRKGVIGENLRP